MNDDTRTDHEHETIVRVEPLRLKLDEARREGARIKVIGVGGGGGNAVNRMVRTGLEGVEFIVANTDLQALANNAAPTRIQIGGKLTKGLGAGADPDIGRRAALEDTDKLIEVLSDADMVFVTTGLGGGTGTGAAPVIAGLASELGALTIAVVTKPFKFEGKRRAHQADRGLTELRDAVDTVITIPNERLLATIDRRTPLPEAFCAADDVLRQAIQGISDLILVPGMINLDFADVKTIMSGMGFAIMGTGMGFGETRAIDAAKGAISSPLLEDASVKGARGVILNITGGPDFSLAEVNGAATFIQEAARGRQHLLRRGHRSGDGWQRQDHGDRDRLRSAGRAAHRAGEQDAGRPRALHAVAARRSLRAAGGGGGRRRTRHRDQSAQLRGDAPGRGDVRPAQRGAHRRRRRGARRRRAPARRAGVHAAPGRVGENGGHGGNGEKIRRESTEERRSGGFENEFSVRSPLLRFSVAIPFSPPPPLSHRAVPHPHARCGHLDGRDADGARVLARHADGPGAAADIARLIVKGDEIAARR